MIEAGAPNYFFVFTVKLIIIESPYNHTWKHIMLNLKIQNTIVKNIHSRYPQDHLLKGTKNKVPLYQIFFEGIPYFFIILLC